MEENRVVLPTPSGSLCGSFQKSCIDDDHYYAFKGIPYAKPPVGQLRFRDPEPIEPWSGERDATAHGPISAQYDAESNSVKGSEDCLYANVYVRSLDVKKLAPVMVWVHGGAFLSGNGNDDEFGPDFLIHKDVVLVTFNYRLGVFGFLNLEDEVAPGNQGLKDQVMLLQWVKKHIASFGGDPDNVTIFGGSAGAASVHYLTISPLAKGLFHKAIVQSGSALNPWACLNEPKNSLYEFLDILGFKERDPKAIVAYLRTVDSSKLIESQTKIMTPQKWLRFMFPFGPGVDDKSSKPFLPVNVSVAAQEGVQVPLMIGVNSMEGLLFLHWLREIGFENLENTLEDYMYNGLSKTLKEYGITITDLKKIYFENEKISELTMENLIKLYSDIVFHDHIHKLAQTQVRKSGAPTYFYKLSYDKNVTLYRNKLITSIQGVTHGDELTYLFKSKLIKAVNLQQFQDGTGAYKVMEQMVELWTNFARTGRPTLTTSELIPCYWLPLASDKTLRYLHIDEELRMEEMLSFNQTLSIKENIKQTP